MKRHVKFACTAATARSNILNLRQHQRAAWLLLLDAYTIKVCINLADVNISSKHLKPWCGHRHAFGREAVLNHRGGYTSV